MLQRELDKQLDAAVARQEIAYDLSHNKIEECVDLDDFDVSENIKEIFHSNHAMRDIVADMSKDGQLDELIFAIKRNNADYAFFVLWNAVLKKTIATFSGEE